MKLASKLTLAAGSTVLAGLIAHQAWPNIAPSDLTPVSYAVPLQSSTPSPTPTLHVAITKYYSPVARGSAGYVSVRTVPAAHVSYM